MLLLVVFFFFFKQKTAYEMLRSLVGSEMCIRDRNMEQEQVSHDENVLVVCYDEQHPKKGRCQKYRLTLFDPKTQRPLADELFDDKSSETIKNFLKKHLDTSEPVFIVTDFDKRYPEI